MNADVRQVLKNSAIAGIGNILGKMAAFLMVPVYTRYLTPGEYGIAELLDLTAIIFGLLLGLGFVAATLRFYYEYPSQEDKNAVVSTSLLSSNAIMLAGVLVLVMFARDISVFVFKTPAYQPYVLLSLFNLFLGATIEVPLALLRAQQRMVAFTLVGIARLVSALSLNILLIVFLDWKIWGILYSTLITHATIGGILTVLTLHRVGLHFSSSKFRSMLAYGYPYVPGTIGMFILHFSDRFFLQQYASLAQVGVYSLAYKFGMAVHLLLHSPFWMVWGAKRFEYTRRADGKDAYARVLTYFVFCHLFAGLALSLLAEEILQIVAAAEFQEAAYLIPAIVLSYLVYDTYYLLETGICVEKKTKYLAIILMSTAGINLILNYLLIPRLAAAGAALATLISFTIMSAATYHVSNRLFPIDYQFARVTKMFAVALCLFAIGRAVSPAHLALSIPVKLLLTAAFPLALLAVRFYHPEELRAVRDLTARLRTKLGLLPARST